METVSVIIITPQAEELEPLLEGFRRHRCGIERISVGRIECALLHTPRMLVAVGGHGKVQLAVQAQYLIDRCPAVKMVMCVGAAGRLSDALAFGDVVVGTCTIEHDYKLRFVQRPLPCHAADGHAVQLFRRVSGASPLNFSVHFGPIASGDEDIVDRARADELRMATGALCVAWEGSGAARAAAFNELSFLELRGITDGADADAATSFRENLQLVMPNISELLLRWGEAWGAV